MTWLELEREKGGSEMEVRWKRSAHTEVRRKEMEGIDSKKKKKKIKRTGRKCGGREREREDGRNCQIFY